MKQRRGRESSLFLRTVRQTVHLAIVLCLALALSGCAGKKVQPIALEPSIQSELKPVHPDEPVEHTFNTRFSLQSALTGLRRVRETSPKPAGEAGMAFNNALGALEGTLRKQEYEIQKLEYELAKIQYRDGQITKEQLDQKESVYRAAMEDFRAFWTDFGIGD